MKNPSERLCVGLLVFAILAVALVADAGTHEEGRMKRLFRKYISPWLCFEGYVGIAMCAVLIAHIIIWG